MKELSPEELGKVSGGFLDWCFDAYFFSDVLGEKHPENRPEARDVVPVSFPFASFEGR